MISMVERKKAVKSALGYFVKARIFLTPAEKTKIEVADFGLSELNVTGLEILTYVNTNRCCAKELVLFPGQTCPEHLHPGRLGQLGKEETFRCRWGEVYLYVPGKATRTLKAKLPAGGTYTVRHQVVLKAGEQYTLLPNTKHWFQAGPQGAVISEFSTRSHDDSDRFSDARIQRRTKIQP
jgi:D-lyxose ketol-isomerase